MKHLYILLILISSILKGTSFPPSNFKDILLQIKIESQSINKQHNFEINGYENQINIINKKLTSKFSPTDELVRLLIQKDNLKELMNKSNIRYNFKLAKMRYLKGLDLIKLLYEKILDLDHHFTALNTYQSISNISNPNSYPEFVQSKKALTENIQSKSSIDIPDILKSNIYVSLATTVVSSFLGSGNKAVRKKEMENISCIIDFTAMMHSDLNIIYYETEFLKDNNNSLKNSILKLFSDYTRVIGYRASLVDCRNMDDWDKLNETLNEFLEKLEKSIKKDSGSSEQRKGIKNISNLEFALDKVFDFLNSYSNFVDQGSKYYNKFYKILNNYKNMDKCSSKLPIQYENLKSDINLSIEKFKTAYDIGELKGTGLRDLIYGTPDVYSQ